MSEAIDEFLAKARKSALEINSLRALVESVANSALAQNASSISALKKIGEHCRQIGAHEAASRVFSKISELDPDDSHASTLRDVLLGQSASSEANNRGPVPFVQLKNFLSDDLHALLLRSAIADLDHFHAAAVYGADGVQSSNSQRRRGRVLKPELISSYKENFLPKLKSALHTFPILSRLGLSEQFKPKFEIQVTNYSEGDFFGRHVDDNVLHHQNRLVSYVYYLRRAPDSFRGGDLLLYDQGPHADGQALPFYTRILPMDNSIVFFLSSSVHEVLPTFVESNCREDGRFSINGWLLRDRNWIEKGE